MSLWSVSNARFRKQPAIQINDEARWVGEPYRGIGGYRESVDGHLHRIAENLIGDAMFAHLGRRRTVITHRKNHEADYGEPVPTTASGWTVTLASVASRRRGESRRTQDDESTPENEAGTPIPSSPGTGEGSDSAIYLDPERLEPTLGTIGTMVHELAHAIRNANGAVSGRASGFLPQYPSEDPLIVPTREELFAVILTNMFLVSEGRDPSVGYYANLRGRFTSPEAIIRRSRGRILRRERAVTWAERMRAWEHQEVRDMTRLARGPIRGFFRRVASLDAARAPYNPFRDVNNPRSGVIVPRNYL